MRLNRKEREHKAIRFGLNYVQYRRKSVEVRSLVYLVDSISTSNTTSEKMVSRNRQTHGVDLQKNAGASSTSERLNRKIAEIQRRIKVGNVKRNQQ